MDVLKEHRQLQPMYAMMEPQQKHLSIGLM